MTKMCLQMTLGTFRRYRQCYFYIVWLLPSLAFEINLWLTHTSQHASGEPTGGFSIIGIKTLFTLTFIRINVCFVYNWHSLA